MFAKLYVNDIKTSILMGTGDYRRSA